MLSLTASLLFISSLGGSSSLARTLTQADLDRGIMPKPGDEMILRDFSRLSPQDALSKTSQRGKWWLRPYKTKDGQSGTMLMTVERDMDRPATCLVPRVTYPLSLRGWYAIWIATYRGPYGGGIDVRLTGDDCFVHMDPQQVAFHAKAPEPRVGAIVEITYKPAVEMTGQGLVFQQPYGSYESFHWGFCEASLAYVRLVRLSDAQVAAFHADQARTDRRLIAYDDDNFSRFWMWGGQDEHAVLRILEPFRYQDIAFFGMCLGTTTATHIPTPHSDMYVNHGRRLGDKRVNRSYQTFVKKGIDLLKLHVERAHKYGFKLLPTLRMSSCAHRGPTRKALPKTKTNRNVLDYATPQVRDHFVKFIRYILEHYDVDGFILDFTRHCVHFDPAEPNKIPLMNEFCAALRRMVDEVSAKKGKKLLLATTFAESNYVSGFQNHYFKVNVAPKDRLAVQGIDVQAWVKNGYFDIIMPEGPNAETFIKMTRGTTTRCYPRWTATRDFNAIPLGRNIHDPTPQEDKKDRPINPHCGPRDYEAGWLKLRDMGADGVYLFNNAHGWNSLGRMGHLDEVRDRVKAGKVHGLIEGPVIEFLD